MIPHNFWTKRPTIKFLTFLEWELIGLYFLCFTLEDWLLNLSVYEQSLKFSIKKMMKILQKHEKIRRTWVKYLNENCFEEPKVCTFGKALRFLEANFFGTILIFHQCAQCIFFSIYPLILSFNNVIIFRSISEGSIYFL